jgi:hypothetical protein
VRFDQVRDEGIPVFDRLRPPSAEGADKELVHGRAVRHEHPVNIEGPVPLIRARIRGCWRSLDTAYIFLQVALKKTNCEGWSSTKRNGISCDVRKSWAPADVQRLDDAATAARLPESKCVRHLDGHAVECPEGIQQEAFPLMVVAALPFVRRGRS